MKLYRRVTPQEAKYIERYGFKNSTGHYLTRERFRGIWLSNRPLDCNDGVTIGADVLFEVDVPETDVALLNKYEWVEPEKTYREWLVPASLINKYRRRIVTSEDELGFDPIFS